MRLLAIARPGALTAVRWLADLPQRERRADPRQGYAHLGAASAQHVNLLRSSPNMCVHGCSYVRAAADDCIWMTSRGQPVTADNAGPVHAVDKYFHGLKQEF